MPGGFMKRRLDGVACASASLTTPVTAPVAAAIVTAAVTNSRREVVASVEVGDAGLDAVILDSVILDSVVMIDSSGLMAVAKDHHLICPEAVAHPLTSHPFASHPWHRHDLGDLDPGAGPLQMRMV